MREGGDGIKEKSRSDVGGNYIRQRSSYLSIYLSINVVQNQSVFQCDIYL